MRILAQLTDRLRRVDRRLKALVFLLAVVFLCTRSAIVVANFPGLLWLGKDTCDVWRAKNLSLWQQDGVEWWHKLCLLEKEMEEIDYHCSDQRWMGNRWVCFDSNLVPHNNCLVYSFGIDYDFLFDDAMAAYGCTVHSFDPSMNITDHQHSERVFFKKIGLAGSDDDHFQPRFDIYVKSPTTWRMRRLSSIMRELGHAPGSLTMLKIDIESYEWNVMEDLLATDGLLASLPQLLIEWHLFADAPARSRYDDLVSIYFRFKGTGFRKFFWGNEGRDHFIGTIRTQAETSWVNPRFFKASAEQEGSLSFRGKGGGRS